MRAADLIITVKEFIVSLSMCSQSSTLLFILYTLTLVWARLALMATVRLVRLCVRHWSIHCRCPLKIAPMEQSMNELMGKAAQRDHVSVS